LAQDHPKCARALVTRLIVFMAGTFHVAWPFMLAVFFGIAGAVQTSHLMRQEVTQPFEAKLVGKASSIVLSPGAELMGSPSSLRSKSDQLDVDFCDYDFPMGSDDSSSCTDNKTHKLIENPGMCRAAADLAGATTTHDGFEISSEWFQSRPRGCFKYSCSESSSGVCYFFNSIGDVSQANITGTPVCNRPRYLFGNSSSNGGCPPGYKVIMNEDACSKAADCMSISQGEEFLIHAKNASKYDEFPKGCFVMKKGGAETVDTVNFNAPLEGIDALPSRPVGTPFCIVAQTVSWGGVATGTTNGTTAETNSSAS